MLPFSGSQPMAFLDMGRYMGVPVFCTKIYITPWMEAAGISKPITFHCSRHTFGTMMLTLGVDLYTVSKLLGHTKVETTQIYAKIINKKKDDAVSLIDDAFSDMEF